MNLYSNKQKWKITLMAFALLLVGASLFISNQILTHVGSIGNLGLDAIQKKMDALRLTNGTFSEMRENERAKMELWVQATTAASKNGALGVDIEDSLALFIIKQNDEIPVIAVDNYGYISGDRNLEFDTTTLRKTHRELSKIELRQLFDDSLLVLVDIWEKEKPAFTVEIIEDFFISYYYKDSPKIDSLENTRDSIIDAFNMDLLNNESLVPVLLIDKKTNEITGTNIPELKEDPSKLEESFSNYAFRE